MRTAQAANDIERDGISTEETSFSIKATGKAFRVLSSGLYSDKPRAILRELACNAKDSHVAAGKGDIPFEVQLPTELEPHLIVRDFGIGLSHEEVMTLYVQYFESTKTESNRFIGALGLGSKSPFSYTDSFLVTSCHNGTKRTYTAFIAENGFPSIVPLTSDTTDQSNGVEVVIPIKPKDFRLFYDKARDVLKRFSPLPTIYGASGFEFPRRDVLLKGKNWSLVSDSSREYGAHAIQGSVPYPLDADAMQLTPEQSVLLSLNIDLDFEIGDLEVAASREALQYDGSGNQRTVANIKKRLDEIIAELPSHFEGKFAACTSEFEARKMYGSLFADSGNISTMLAQLSAMGKLSFEWRGKKITESAFRVKRADFDGLTAAFYSEAWRRRGNRFRETLLDDDGEADIKIDANENVQIFINDLGRGARTRLRNYFETVSGQSKRLFVFATPSEDGGLIDYTLDEELIAKLEQTLDGFTFRYVSDLPKPVRMYTQGPRSRVFKLVSSDVSAGDFSLNRRTWYGSEVDFEEGGIYVEIKRYEALDDKREVASTMLVSALREAIKLKIFNPIDEQLRGVPSTFVRKFKKSDKWVNIFDLLRKRLQENIKKRKLTERVALQRSLNDFIGRNTTMRDNLSNLRLLATMLGKNHDMNKFLVDFEAMQEDTHAANLAESMAQRLHVPFKAQPAVLDFENRWSAIWSRYPILQVLFSQTQYHMSDKMKLVADYVTMMDKMRTAPAVVAVAKRVKRRRRTKAQMQAFRATLAVVPKRKGMRRTKAEMKLLRKALKKAHAAAAKAKRAA